MLILVKDDLKMVSMKREQLEIEMTLNQIKTKSQLQAVVEFEQALNDMIDAKGFAYTLGVLKNQFKLVVEHQVPISYSFLSCCSYSLAKFSK